MEEQSMLQSEVDRFRDEREQIEMEKKNLLTNKCNIYIIRNHVMI